MIGALEKNYTFQKPEYKLEMEGYVKLCGLYDALKMHLFNYIYEILTIWMTMRMCTAINFLTPDWKINFASNLDYGFVEFAEGLTFNA